MVRKPKEPVKGRGRATPLDRKMISEFGAETGRMEAEATKTTDPLARKMILEEVARRKVLLREWRGDIRRG